MRTGSSSILWLLVVVCAIVALVTGLPWTNTATIGTHPFIAMYSVLIASVVGSVLIVEVNP